MESWRSAYLFRALPSLPNILRLFVDVTLIAPALMPLTSKLISFFFLGIVTFPIFAYCNKMFYSKNENKEKERKVFLYFRYIKLRLFLFLIFQGFCIIYFFTTWNRIHFKFAKNLTIEVVSLASLSFLPKCIFRLILLATPSENIVWKCLTFEK